MHAISLTTNPNQQQELEERLLNPFDEVFRGVVASAVVASKSCLRTTTTIRADDEKRYRELQLALQLPRQDISLAYCKYVEEVHWRSFEEFVRVRNEHALDIGCARPCRKEDAVSLLRYFSLSY